MLKNILKRLEIRLMIRISLLECWFSFKFLRKKYFICYYLFQASGILEGIRNVENIVPPSKYLDGYDWREEGGSSWGQWCIAVRCTEEDITVLLETFLVHARIEKVVLCSGTLMLYYSGDRNWWAKRKAKRKLSVSTL